MNGKHVFAANVITELVKSEAGDYMMYQDFEIGEIDDHGEDCYSVEVHFTKENHTMNFRVSNIKDTKDIEDVGIKIEVCMYEDVYEEVRTYDWHVKYFWIALLWK